MQYYAKSLKADLINLVLVVYQTLYVFFNLKLKQPSQMSIIF